MKKCCLLLLICLMLAGCRAGSSEEKTGPYLTLTAKKGIVTIEKKLLSENVLYINYDCDGIMMQLLAGVASDGSFRVSLNTCQSCSPSPRAYFVQEDGWLVCQNCGNKFTMENVGVQTYGCNPTYIESTQTEDAILIDTAQLQSFASMFTSWKGVTGD